MDFQMIVWRTKIKTPPGVFLLGDVNYFMPSRSIVMSWNIVWGLSVHIQVNSYRKMGSSLKCTYLLKSIDLAAA